MFPQKNLTVAVVGATGKQGGAVARALVKRGHQVRALTRHTDSPAASALYRLGAHLVYSDLADPISLDKALAGADAVFGVTTPFGTNVEIEAAQGCALVDAAAANGVSHFVFSSVAQANLATGVPHFESKYRVECYLATKKDMAWTVIAPAAFMADFEGGWYKRSLDAGKLALVMPPQKSLQFICSEDIGEFAALAITQPQRFASKRIDIAGDEVNGEQLARLFSRAYGHAVTYQEVPLAVAETYSPDLARMFCYFQEVGLHIDIPTLHKSYPEVDFHTFARWIAERRWKPA